MKIKNIFGYFAIGVLFFTLLFTSAIHAQDDDDTEESNFPELEKKLEKLELQDKIQEKQQSIIDRSIPDADSLRGKTEFKELKGEFIESRIQAYRGLSNAVNSIVCNLRAPTNPIIPPNTTLVVYSPEVASQIQKYRAMIAKLNQMQKFYIELKKEAEELKPEKDLKLVNPSSVLPLIGEMAKLFQRTDSFTPTVYDISEKELIAEFFSRLRNRRCDYTPEDKKNNPKNMPENVITLYYPAITPISTASVELTESDIWKLTQNVDKARQEAEDIIAELTKGKAKTEFSKELAKLERNRKTYRKFFEGLLKEMGIPYDKEEDPNKPGNNSETTTVKPPQPADNGNSPVNTQTVTVNVSDKESEEKKKTQTNNSGDFFAFLEGEKLFTMLKDNKGYWIQMNAAKAGGNVRVISIPIVDIFVGNRVRFSGGAIVTYHIFDLEGKYVDSGTAYGYREYTGASNITKK